MTQISANSLDSTFAALADPTRRAILARLASGQASVTELAEPFAMSQPAISKHLKVLERAGLISRARDAQRRPRQLEAKPLAEASGWLEGYRQFWEGRFQHLDALLDELKSGEKRSKSAKHLVDFAASRSTHSRGAGRSRRLGNPPSNKRRGKHQ
jgi:DNA-binding transcriptional ArsR family regulator